MWLIDWIREIWQENADMLHRMWNEDVIYEWWQMLLVGLFFLVCATGICGAFCFARRGVIIQCGFRKRSAKAMRNYLKSYSFLDQLLLFPLVCDAEKKNPLLYTTLFCHCLNLLAYILTWVGFVGAMITLCDGWAFTLLMLPQYCSLLLIAIEFIPHLLWLPSERKRYGIFK